MPKTCGKCGKPKDLKLFYENKRTADKLHNWCKDCCIEAAKAYQVANKGRIALLRKRRRIAKRALNKAIEY